MGKIKLNLVSGAVVEKPLINAFKASENTYIVLDNEINGSMGLPIILVCKLESGKVTKIIDQNEWTTVKEYLKKIIAGNQVEFVKVDSEMVADDIYYTQLTLPVPSFDALKNAYKVDENPSVGAESVTPVVEGAPVVEPVNNVETPVNNVQETPSVVEPVSVGTVEATPTPVSEPVVPSAPVNQEVSVTPVVEPVTEPVMPTDNTPVDSQVSNDLSSPVIDMPVNTGNVEMTSPVVDVNTPIVEPIIPSAPVGVVEETTTINNIDVPVSGEVAPIPVASPEPVVETSTSTVTNDMSIFKEQKEAFMQACENMFDALVQKFERELDNNK